MDVGIIRSDERSAPFFAAAARDALAVRRCEGCGGWLGPEAAGCPGCGGTDLGWAEASGQGALVSWAILPDADAPGVLALVELDEGPWLHSRLDGADPAGLRAGQRVSAAFVHPDEGESYPVFRLAETDG
jgi:uncharacterized OB-fold protein